MLASGAAHAQTVQKTTAQQDESKTTQVVVQGKRAEVEDRIDRRIYDIKDDPDSQTGMASDVLGKLPSVQVSPAGAVSLRGDGRVLVLVDGKYPANGNAVIQNLSASDIDRIEVMTTPSAEYAADAPGGVINIITKKRHPLGLSGNVTARTGNVSSNINASAVFTEGPWSLDTRLFYNHLDRQWRQENILNAPIIYTDTGRYHSRADSFGGTANLTYKFSETRSLALDAESRSSWLDMGATSAYRSSGANYDEDSHNRTRDQYAYAELIYEDNDPDAGRHLTFDTWHVEYDTLMRNFARETYLSSAADVADYGFRQQRQGPEDDIKIDYEGHLKSGDLITSGLEWARIESDIVTVYSDDGTVPGPYADGFSRHFSGARTTLDAYVTYQHAFGAWTLLPGLRAEQEQVYVRADGGVADARNWHLLPSLHLSRDLGDGKLRLAYNRKIERPQLTQYDPSLIYYVARNAYQGNPDLKSPRTDSYEIAYDLKKGQTLTGVSLYRRATFDLLSTYSRDMGAGVELTLKGPLPHRFKYALSLDLFYQQMPYYNGVAGATHGQTTYNSNGTLEYDSKGGDQYQLAFGLVGPQLSVQGYTKATSHLDLTWQHPLTKKLSLVVSASNILLGQDRVAVYTTPDFKGRAIQYDADRWYRIALAWKFGVRK
jgi:outer membrane receptor for ferrienterochelin and colicin